MALGNTNGAMGTLFNNPFAAAAGVTLDPIQAAAERIAAQQAAAQQVASLGQQYGQQATGAYNAGAIGQRLGTPLAQQAASMPQVPTATGRAAARSLGGDWLGATGSSALPSTASALTTAASSPASAPVEMAVLKGMARRPFAGPLAASEVQGGILGAGGRLGPASLGRGGAYALGGYAAGQIANKLIGDDGKGNTAADEIATGALTGAGAGAGVGSMIAPGIGTLIGGAAGFVGGGLIGAFGPKQTGEKAVTSEYQNQAKKLREALSAYGVSREFRSQALAQFRAASLSSTSKGEVKTLAKSVLANLPAAAAEDKAAEEQRKFQQSNNAAVQAWLGPMLQEVLDKQWFSAQQDSAMANSLAGRFTDPAMQAAAKSMASSQLTSTAAQQAGLLSQLAATPSLYGYATGINPDTGMANTDLTSLLMASPNPSNPGYDQWVAAQQALQQASAGGGAGTDMNAALQQLVSSGQQG